MNLPSDRARYIFESLNTEQDIEDLINEEVESLYVDYKLAEDQGRRTTSSLRKNLAKAISGFGNTAGGVVVWGVRCESRRNNDKPEDDVSQRIADPAAFEALLYGEISGSTYPIHTTVETKSIISNSGDGWVIMLVPLSNRRPLSFSLRLGN